MRATKASGFPTYSPDGLYTFAGLIHEYYEEIAEKWDEEKTSGRCLNDYERRILPTIEELGWKDTAASKLGEEDYERILQTLAAKHHYSDGTIAHYRLLLTKVYQAGVNHGHISDFLSWPSVFDPETADDAAKESHRVECMTRIRKSLSVQEEFKVLEWFSKLSPETAAGEDIGLMLMFTMGVRNNESCGANYSSVHLLDYHDDTPVFDMLQSTKEDSSETKSGGKTSNAPRTVLMMEPLFDFIQKRKEFIAHKVSSGDLVLDGRYNTVDDLPIVCRKNDLLQRSSSRYLAEAGKKLFNEIGIDKSEMSFLFEIICSSEFQSKQIDEKEPTTYLFRRNCATHLYQLGFAPSEIQYWMGHEIEDPFTQRSFYADPDQIYEFKARWDQHPVLNLYRKKYLPYKEITEGASLPARIKDAEQISFKYSLSTKRPVLISFESQEPQSDLTFTLQSDAKSCSIEVQSFPRERSFPRRAVISKEVQNAYSLHDVDTVV